MMWNYNCLCANYKELNVKDVHEQLSHSTHTEFLVHEFIVDNH